MKLLNICSPLGFPEYRFCFFKISFFIRIDLKKCKIKYYWFFSWLRWLFNFFYRRKQYYRYFDQKWLFEVRNVLMMDLFLTNTAFIHKTLIDKLEWCGSLLGYFNSFYQLFGLSFWRQPFTAEDTLVYIGINANFYQICPHKETNSSTCWMAWEWVNFQCL